MVLGAGVQRGVVGVDNLFGVVLVVFGDQFDLVVSAGFVDFLRGDFCAAVGGDAVQGGGTGQRSDMGDLQGNGLLSEGGAHSQRQRQGESQSDKLLHLVFLLNNKVAKHLGFVSPIIHRISGE